MIDVAICRAAYRSRSGSVNEAEDTECAQAAACLEAAGLTVQVFDFYLDPEMTIERVLAADPTVVAFGVRWPGEFWQVSKQLIRELRAQDSRRRHVTAFGLMSVGHEKSFREAPLDSIVYGEEADLVALVTRVCSGEDWRTAPGICYPGDGRLHYNPPSPLVELDTLPMAKRYFLEKLMAENADTRFFKGTIKTARGCYGRCSFCYIDGYDRLYGHYPWRAKSPERVLAEIEYLYTTFNISDFVFEDADFFGAGPAAQERAKRIAQLIIERNLDISFLIYARANDLRRDTLQLLREAGLFTVLIGVESFVPAQLRRYNKGTTVQQNLDAIQLCKDLDLYIQIGLIPFDRHSTMAELREHHRHLHAITREKAHLFVDPRQFVGGMAIPLEGTRLASEYERGARELSDPLYLNLFRDRLQEMDAALVYEFEHRDVAALCDAGWYLAREVGSQMYAKRRVQAEYLNRLVANEEDEEALTWVERLQAWRGDLAQFTVDALGMLIDGLDGAADPMRRRWEVLDQVWEALAAMNRRVLGPEHAGLRWVEDYRMRRDRELSNAEA